jgi:hypothetical protein
MIDITQDITKKDVIKIAFETETIIIDINDIVPVKKLLPNILSGKKYKQILSSVKEVGIIEPPIVKSQNKSPNNKLNKYILLDGHVRVHILKELGHGQVNCIISKDDEAFTYNKYINRLAPVQEQQMILKAIERGVSEEKLAKALNIDISSLKRKRNLTNGICAEVVDLLKDKVTSAGIFDILKKMKPFKQIEVAKMMCETACFTMQYANALLQFAAPDQLLSPPTNQKNARPIDEVRLSTIQAEIDAIQKDFKAIEENYGMDVLNLTLAKSYLANLLSNAKVIKYLAGNHPEFLSQFQKITEMNALG